MNSNVFALVDDDGRLLDPATQATVLAKYSRSPLSAKQIVMQVTPDDAQAFQKKYGVDYGHSSVAELATIPYCFEGVSIVASKFLERYQRAGYSEKSTRYQVFSPDSFVEPEGTHPMLRQAAEILYKAYAGLEKPILEHVAKLVARTALAGEGWENLVKSPTVKARAFDNLRYLLPAGTGTNLAAVLNARDARYMMGDLLGSTNPELQNIGRKMVLASTDVAPVFAMGVEPRTFEPSIVSLGPLSDSIRNEWHVFVESRRNRDEASDIEFEFWTNVRDRYGMTKKKFDDLMSSRTNSQVPDIFKTISMTFDILMDYGAFRDLQRHRRCEQYVELLGTKYGYLVPDDLVGTEFESTYRDAMDRSSAIVDKLVNACLISREVAQYGIALGFIHRSMFQMDLKELYYITELRTQPQCHISYRRVAYRMYQHAQNMFPSLMKWCRAIDPREIGVHT